MSFLIQWLKNITIMITTAIKNPSKTSEATRLWTILKYAYTVVPIVAGLDKFTNILVNWESYLSPAVTELLPFDPSVFMAIVGVIEIIAGFLVLFKTEFGGYLVAIWLTLIAFSLLVSWHHPDVAVRDVVMALGAYTLARLTKMRADAQASV